MVEQNDTLSGVTAADSTTLGAGRVRFTVTAHNVYGSGVTNLRWENFGFNTVSSLTLIESGAGQNLWSLGATPVVNSVEVDKNLDGFGKFEQVLNWNPDAGQSTIKFEISGLGTNATIANFTQFNNGGSNVSLSGSKLWAFAGHIKGNNLPNDTHFVGVGDSTNDGILNLDGNPDVNAVPAPPAIVLAVIGIGAFGMIARRMRRKQAVA